MNTDRTVSASLAAAPAASSDSGKSCSRSPCQQSGLRIEIKTHFDVLIAERQRHTVPPTRYGRSAVAESR